MNAPYEPGLKRFSTPDYDVVVVRSATRRKTLSFSIDHGAVVVRAPVHVADKHILDVLKRHQARIAKLLRQTEMAERVQPVLPWVNGRLSVFDYLMDVQFTPALEWAVRADGRVLRIFGPASGLSDTSTIPVLVRWLQRRARDIISDRAELWAQRMGVSFGRVAIRDQRTRWGSCSSGGNLNFNWRLVLAPPSVLDYVVVHELCHRLEMNHSKRFWAHVERWFPDYRAARSWLREQGQTLHFS